MEIIKDMVNLLKYLVVESKLENIHDEEIRIVMTDPSRIQLIALEYSPADLFPIWFRDVIGIDLDDIKKIDGLFSNFEHEYHGEVVEMGHKPFYRILLQDRLDYNPKIRAYAKYIDYGDFPTPKVPEFDSAVKFWMDKKFDCKKIHLILVARGNNINIGTLDDYETKAIEEEYYSPISEILNDKIPAYYVLPANYNGKPHETCKAINMFIDVFGGAWGEVSGDYPLKMEGEKTYYIDDMELLLRGTLITAPRLPEDLKI